MLGKLFGFGKKNEAPSRRNGPGTAGPDIPFGRYSDNNKPVAKVTRWTDADNFLKKKNIRTVLMLFLNTCGMIPHKMWCMNAMGLRVALNFTRVQKLCGAVLRTKN